MSQVASSFADSPRSRASGASLLTSRREKLSRVKRQSTALSPPPPSPHPSPLSPPPPPPPSIFSFLIPLLPVAMPGQLKLQIHIYSNNNVRSGVNQTPQVKFLEMTPGDVSLEDLSIKISNHHSRLYKRSVISFLPISTRQTDADETPNPDLSTSTKSKTATAMTWTSPIKSTMCSPTNPSAPITPLSVLSNTPLPARPPFPPSLDSVVAHGVNLDNKVFLGR